MTTRIKLKPMFTVEQIKAAHAKVKTGADFPAYVQDLIKLGITNYETYVTDGHTDYVGKDGYAISSDNKYATLAIADTANVVQFEKDLKAHQKGNTDYATFCSDCARSGVEKWKVDLEAMTCTYYDKAGNDMLTEAIPEVQ